MSKRTFAYMDILLKRGLSVDEVASWVTFYFGAEKEFLRKAAYLREPASTF